MTTAKPRTTPPRKPRTAATPKPVEAEREPTIGEVLCALVGVEHAITTELEITTHGTNLAIARGSFIRSMGTNDGSATKAVARMRKVTG